MRFFRSTMVVARVHSDLGLLFNYFRLLVPGFGFIFSFSWGWLLPTSTLANPHNIFHHATLDYGPVQTELPECPQKHIIELASYCGDYW